MLLYSRRLMGSVRKLPIYVLRTYICVKTRDTPMGSLLGRVVRKTSYFAFPEGSIPLPSEIRNILTGYEPKRASQRSSSRYSTLYQYSPAPQ